ncbi:MAG: methylmalonyl Co-A mutase-associated GTPase MeaB, partial [Actinomycetota bacterium]|nr:methylmalonyl Co-A mutase-associated GTPase MeaB [Actinomycetota bacterium]
LRARIDDLRPGAGLVGLAERVVDGTTDPYAAADALVAALT